MPLARTHEVLQIIDKEVAACCAPAKKAAKRIYSDTNRIHVEYLIQQGALNADQTVFTEQAVPPSEWDAIFRGSVESLLACSGRPGSNAYSRHVFAFFAKFGIKP